MASLLSSLLLGACSLFGMRDYTEQPHYAVVSHVGPVEIRQYGQRLAVETTILGGEEATRNLGFRKLASYIFGRNAAERSIEMSAPVAQSATPEMLGAQLRRPAVAEGEKIAMAAPISQAGAPDGGWTIRFFLPAALTLETARRPLDPSVRIVTVPAELMAALRFSGVPGPTAVAAQRQRLVTTLNGSSWHAVGEPVSWFYDPPWTLPPLRRNEVAVEVRLRAE